MVGILQRPQSFSFLAKAVRVKGLFFKSKFLSIQSIDATYVVVTFSLTHKGNFSIVLPRKSNVLSMPLSMFGCYEAAIIMKNISDYIIYLTGFCSTVFFFFCSISYSSNKTWFIWTLYGGLVFGLLTGFLIWQNEIWKNQAANDKTSTEPKDSESARTEGKDVKVGERNFHLLQSAQQQIEDLQVDFRIRGNNTPENNQFGDIQGPVCQLALPDQHDVNAILFQSSDSHQLARVGSGKGGRELRVKFRLTGNNYPLGHEVAILGSYSRIALDISELYKAVDLGLDAQERCEMTALIKVNGIDAALVHQPIMPCSILGKGPVGFDNKNELPNVPFVFTLLREKRFDGPLLYSFLISNVSEYSKVIRVLADFAARSKTFLMPSPVAIFIFDHTSGNRVDFSRTTIRETSTIIQNYATAGTVPVSIVVGGAGAIGISGPVSFTPGVK